MKRLLLGAVLAVCLSAAPLAADGGVTMTAALPAYDPYIDVILCDIVNETGTTLSYGMSYEFQRQHNGSWVDVRTQDGIDTFFPSISTWLMEQATISVPCALYARPFAPGRYRVVKNITGAGKVSAEFDILSTAVTPRLALPEKLTLTYTDSSRSGSVTLVNGWQTNPAHELLAFQKTAAPASLPASAPTVEAVWVANRLKTQLTITQAKDGVYLQNGTSWYKSADPNAMDRLCERVEWHGGFAPKTGKELIALFQKTGALKEEPFSPADSMAPYETGGWKSPCGISIFQFPDAQEARVLADGISADGQTIRITKAGSYGDVAYYSQEVDWTAPPHFYHAGSRLVLYCGTDEAVMDAIERVLGPQFAGDGKEIVP